MNREAVVSQSGKEVIEKRKFLQISSEKGHAGSVYPQPREERKFFLTLVKMSKGRDKKYSFNNMIIKY